MLQLLLDVPNTVGGVLFAVGGGCEAKINHIFSFSFGDLGWCMHLAAISAVSERCGRWVGLLSGAGGSLFLLGALVSNV